MMKDEWQSIDFSHKRFPCINGRYILRVVFWRFFEISSRVCLLTIVWINMGGFTVFLFIGFELAYLVILSYGSGTLDIMGNIVYLRAANSMTTNKSWAQKWTYYFWIYRVISTYLLLLLCTIFATKDFDGPLIQNYTNRNEQTLRQNVGLFVFIYCWISTPIWQWVGGMIVFDFDNLQSITRDLDQLAEDKKWFDVWELIQFGASDYDPKHAITSLFYTTIVNKKILEFLGSTFYDSCIDQGNINWDRLLLDAAKANNTKFIKFICDHKDGTKIDVNKKDKSGKSPIFYSYKYEIIEYLIKEQNADCQLTDDDGNTILHHYFYSSFNKDLQKENKEVYGEDIPIIKFLIEETNLNPDITNKNGYNLLDVVIDTNQAASIQAYMKKKCKNQNLKRESAKQTETETETDENREKEQVQDPEFDGIERIHTLMDEEKESKNKIQWSRQRDFWADNASVTRIGTTFIGFLPCIAMFIGIDIILLIFQQENKCESKNDKLVPLDDWIITGTILSIIIIGAYLLNSLTTAISAVRKNFVAKDDEEEVDDDCGICGVGTTACNCCLLIFYIIWAGMGVVVQENMDRTTENGKQCSDAVLAWVILKFGTWVVICCYPCLRIFWDDGDGGFWECWECKCCGGKDYTEKPEEYAHDHDENEEAMQIELQIDEEELKELDGFKILRTHEQLMQENELKDDNIPSCDKCRQKMILLPIGADQRYMTERCDGCDRRFVGDSEYFNKFRWICQSDKYTLCKRCGNRKRKSEESGSQFIDAKEKKRQKSAHLIEINSMKEKDIPKCRCGKKMLFSLSVDVPSYISLKCMGCSKYNDPSDLVWFCEGVDGFRICKDCGLKQIAGLLGLDIMRDRRDYILNKTYTKPECKCGEKMYSGYIPSKKFRVRIQKRHGKWMSAAKTGWVKMNRDHTDWAVCEEFDSIPKGDDKVVFYSVPNERYLNVPEERGEIMCSPSNTNCDDETYLFEMVREDEQWAIKSCYGQYLTFRAESVYATSGFIGKDEVVDMILVDSMDEAKEDADVYKCDNCGDNFDYKALWHCMRREWHNDDYRLCKNCGINRNMQLRTEEFYAKIRDERWNVSKGIQARLGIKDEDIPNCVCKKPMILIKANEARYMDYEEVSVVCAQCKQRFEGDITVWHCNYGNVDSVHPNGYQLCVDCVMNKINDDKDDAKLEKEVENRTLNNDVNEQTDNVNSEKIIREDVPMDSV